VRFLLNLPLGRTVKTENVKSETTTSRQTPTLLSTFGDRNAYDQGTSPLHASYGTSNETGLSFRDLHREILPPMPLFCQHPTTLSQVKMSLLAVAGQGMMPLQLYNTSSAIPFSLLHTFPLSLEESFYTCFPTGLRQLSWILLRYCSQAIAR
jgi:hypothetical protein